MQTKKVRCFWTLYLALALALSASLALAAEKQPPEGKVAAVNGVAISQEDFDLEMRRVTAQFQRSGRFPSGAELSQVRMGVVENLIARELLYQESQRKGIKADPKAVNEQLAAVKARFPTEAEYQTALTSMNLSEATIGSQIQRDLAIKELIDTQFVQKITVSDEEMKVYYDSNPDSFKKPEQVKASHILIKVEPQADASQNEMIQGKLKKGEDFGTLAKEYSEGPSNTKGGDLGYFSRGQMVKPFEEAAFALKQGEVSEIVETRFGYHLIKVTDKTTETTIAYNEIKDNLGRFLKQEKLRKEMTLYIASLKKNAKVETFLKETSQ
jgi:peptidyl-prolyl cis-trans isomerase C